MSETSQDSKEERKFEENHKKLIALLSGESLLGKRAKLGNEQVMAAMKELVAEKEETLKKEIKSGITELIENHIAFQKFVGEKKKELEKAVSEKQKEFNTKASAIFSKIDDLDTIIETYFNSLSSISPQKTVDDPPPSPGSDSNSGEI